jgi:hypothetical protein
VGMLGGYAPSGEPLPATPDHLYEVAESWRVSEHTPPEIRDQLRVSRDLFTHCLLVWEFSAVGVAWSLLAVESALRWALGARQSTPFQQLIKRAHREGLLTDELADALDAGRRLRNDFSHPRNQPAWTLGMAAPALRRSHAVVFHVSEIVGGRGSTNPS